MSEPNPSKNLLKSTPFSFMGFQPEQLIFDKEVDGLVRFRAMFEMPNWEGVEVEEFVYVIEGPDERLDKIAARFWGDEYQAMYWVIAARNHLDLPDVQLFKGKKLRIPSREWVETKFMPQAQKYIER